jgi:hypothetical protein
MTMTKQPAVIDTDDVHRQAYSHRQRVAVLSRQFYGDESPSNDELFADLLEAETTLIDLEHADQERRTMLVDTSESGDTTHEVRGAGTTGLNATAELRMSEIPTSIYHLFSSKTRSLVDFSVHNASPTYRRLRLTSFIERYSARAVDTIEVAPDDTADVRQLPTLFHDRVRDVHELTAASLNVLVEDLDGEAELHRSVPVRLLARSYVPLYVRDATTGHWTDLSRYLGAFVTPNVPAVMEFLRTVADHHPSKRLVGYLGRTAEENVDSQVHAIFDALRETGTTYVHSVAAFNPDGEAAGQRVRLPRESLAGRQANCVDGTVLVASLLEAMSINAAIVVTPQHAFVGWERADGIGQWDYLETTMIGGRRSYQESRDSADREAAKREPLGLKHPQQFRRWSLPELRTTHGITPLE